MSGIMDVVMQGQCSEDDISRLLTALHDKGESGGRSGRRGRRDCVAI